MQTSSGRRDIEKNVWKVEGRWLLFALCFLAVGGWLLGCAATGGGKRLPPKAPKQKIERERDAGTGAKKEIIRNEPRPPEVGSTPKARAAASTIESGRRELAAGNYERAETLFQEAINIDSANGISYYYLARAKYELGQYQQAGGVLDKAEGLLQGSPAWLEAITALRGMIKENAP